MSWSLLECYLLTISLSASFLVLSLLYFLLLSLDEVVDFLSPSAHYEESPFHSEESGLEHPHLFQHSNAMLVTPDDVINGVLGSFLAGHQVTPKRQHPINRSDNNLGLIFKELDYREISRGVIFDGNGPRG